jgi:hypothetical protein
MTKIRLLVVGVGGRHGPPVPEVAELSGQFGVVGFLDDFLPANECVNASMAGGTLLGHRAWMQASSALGYGVKVAAGEVLLTGTGRESKQVG